jgi:hypothetical protein
MTPDIENTVIKCYFLLVLFLTPSELINRKSFLSIAKMKSPKMQLVASCPERSSILLLLTFPVILSWKFQCSRHEPGTLVDKLTKLRFGRRKYHCSIPEVAANFLFAPAFRKDQSRSISWRALYGHCLGHTAYYSLPSTVEVKNADTTPPLPNTSFLSPSQSTTFLGIAEKLKACLVIT